jgi:hypothetical protein
MRTISIMIIYLCLLCPNSIGQIKDSTDLIINDWSAKGFGNKKLNINDTIKFISSINSKIECDYIKWKFYGKGKVEINDYFPCENNKEAIMVISGDLKWAIDRKKIELLIYKNSITEKYKIVKLNKVELVIIRIK